MAQYWQHLVPFVSGTVVRASAANAKFDGIDNAFSALDTELTQKRIRLPDTFAGNAQIPEKAVANTLLLINSSGDLDLYAKQTLDDAVASAVASAATTTSDKAAVTSMYNDFTSKKALFDSNYSTFNTNYTTFGTNYADFASKYSQFKDTDYPQFQSDYAQFQLDLPATVQAKTDAQAARDAAQTHAGNAASSATAAGNSATASAGSASLALTYEQAAYQAKLDAEAAANLATGAEANLGPWDASGGTLPVEPAVDSYYVISEAGDLTGAGLSYVYEGDTLHFNTGLGSWFVVKPSSSFLRVDGGNLSGNLTLNNAISVQGRKTDNSAHSLLKMHADDRVDVGNLATPLALVASAVPQWSGPGGAVDLLHTGGGQTVNGNFDVAGTLGLDDTLTIAGASPQITFWEPDQTTDRDRARLIMAGGDLYAQTEGGRLRITGIDAADVPALPVVKTGGQYESLLHTGGGQTVNGAFTTTGTIISGVGTGELRVGGQGAGNTAIALRYDGTIASVTSGVVGTFNTIWHAGNDGSGSGLDADLLDGVNSSQFLRSDAADFMSSTLETRYGIHGGYGQSQGTGANWGATIWGMGLSYDGTGYGTTFANTGMYGIAWVRGSHASASASIGEGLYVYQAGVLKGGIGSSGIYSVGNLSAYSDRRVKDKIVPIANALDKVDRISGNTYERTDMRRKRMAGVVAQEILEVLPEAVSKGGETGHYSVDYLGVVALLVEAVKELRTEVRALKEAT